MAKPNEPYRYIIVESYRPANTSGLHGPIHIRPVEGQEVPTDIHVECSKELSDPAKYPVGTKFRLKVKLTDRKGGGEFLYSSWQWKAEVIGRGAS